MRSTERSRIDLHAHSSASDGMLSPSELVARAAERGIEVLALTDHDTTAGIAEARQAARRHGVGLVPAIEMSAAAGDKPLHVVGLGIDPDAAGLRAAIGRLRELRAERARRIGRRLARLGIAQAYEGACAEAGAAVPGRAHFARWLIGRGICADNAEIFSRLLGRGRPAYVATVWPEIEDTVACIREAGGVAVLAHPMRYKFTATWLRRIAGRFRECGGSAIEVVLANQPQRETATAAAIARHCGLMGSVGSDFHACGGYAPELGAFGALPPEIEPVWESLPAASVLAGRTAAQ
ncbi:MAG: PHP domain-containing protein [Gammaproteobacteria bacterium]|nr:PHP domain-containing protein [Gammaproteobacteria bacterium]